MRWGCLRAVCACCLFAFPVYSAEPEGPALTLRAAIDRARANQPALAGFLFDLTVQEAHAGPPRTRAG